MRRVIPGLAGLIATVWTVSAFALGIPAAEYHAPGDRARATKLNADGHRAFNAALEQAGGRAQMNALPADDLYWDAVVADPSFAEGWYDAAGTSALLGRTDAALQALANVRHLDTEVDLLARVSGDPNFASLLSDEQIRGGVEIIAVRTAGQYEPTVRPWSYLDLRRVWRAPGHCYAVALGARSAFCVHQEGGPDQVWTVGTLVSDRDHKELYRVAPGAHFPHDGWHPMRTFESTLVPLKWNGWGRVQVELHLSRGAVSIPRWEWSAPLPQGKKKWKVKSYRVGDRDVIVVLATSTQCAKRKTSCEHAGRPYLVRRYTPPPPTGGIRMKGR